MNKNLKKKEFVKRRKGITLIALVITIIVLLILAGISISMLSGDNSILRRAEEAREKTDVTVREEQRKITMLEAATNVEEFNYSGVKIPVGFAPTKKEGESTIDEGLVITDSQGNEYVWIEVPNDESGPDYTNVENNDKIDTSKIYIALKKYCATDLEGKTLVNSTSKDEWYDSDGKKSNSSTNLNDSEVCGLTNKQYTELYDKMLISIYKNGGFWIGRYEAGTTSPRKSKNDSIENIVPASKQNLYPINFVSCSQAEKLASTVLSNNNYNSSILFGIQWDLILKFLNNKGVNTSLLNVDSGTWGNYDNNSFRIDRGQYCSKSPWNEFISYKIASNNKITVENNITTKIGTNENKIAILLTTGASDTNKKLNIYDLAGNVSEFTLEMAKYSNTNTCNYYRGGCIMSSSDSANVSNRWCYDFDKMFSCVYGFRVTIY